MNRLASLLLASLLLVGSSQIRAAADENPWIRVNVTVADKAQRTALLKSGLDVTDVNGLQADVLVTQAQLDALRAQGMRATVVREFSHGGAGLRTTPEFLPEYYTYTEAAAKLQAIATAYPSITQLTNLGNSLEGRAIWALEVSDNPGVDEGEPEVLVMGCHHSREAISVIIPLALADSLTMDYGTNPQFTNWVNTRRIWIVPVVNPDGLTYCETTLYMWRKNRRPNGGGQFGVDINRNYNFMWGHDDIGSSPDPSTSDEIYRGTSAASEPETQAIQNFANSRRFAFSLSYHSYGNDLLWGQGWQPGLTADQDVFYRYGQIVTAQNAYSVGNPANSVIYLTNGESDDWMYGGPGHAPVIAMTPEVGTSSDFFNPPASRIPALVVQGLACVWPALQYADRPSQLAPPGQMALAPLPVDTDGSYDVSWSLPTAGDTQPVQFEVVEKTNPSVVTDGAESGTANFVLNSWTQSTARKFAGSFSFYSGRGDGLDRFLWAKEPYVVQAGDSLSAQIWVNLENEYDYLYAVLSTDGGRSFVTLPGTGTTNAEPPPAGPTGQNCGNGITNLGLGSGFHRYAFNLANWVGQSVWLGFRMNTDGGVNNEGVYVDDVRPVQTFGTSTSLSNSITAQDYPISGKSDGTYYYAVRGYDAEGNWGYWSANLPVVVQLATSVVGGVSRPTFELGAGRPTPFGTRTEIRFSLPVAEAHSLLVYDVAGRLVRTLSEGVLSAGAHSAVWDGRDDAGHRVPAGVYFYALHASQGDLRSRTVLLR